MDRKDWYRGAVLQPENIALPNDLPLMVVKLDERIMTWIAQRKAAYVTSPVTDAEIPISWEQWKPGAIIKEKVKVGGLDVEKEVAVMPVDTSSKDPKFEADGKTAAWKGHSAATEDHRFEYTINSPYTGKPVTVPVSNWVKGGAAPEIELQKIGVQVSMLLPATGRLVMGSIGKPKTFSYMDETGQKDIALPPSTEVAALLNDGFADKATGAVFRLDGKPRIYKNESNDYVNPLTGKEYTLAEVAMMTKDPLNQYGFAPDVQAAIDKNSQTPNGTPENTIPKDKRSSFMTQNGVYMSYEKKDGGYWISKKGTGLSGFVFGKERAAKSGSNWDEVCNLMTTRARAAGQIPQNYRFVPAGDDRVKAVRE